MSVRDWDAATYRRVAEPQEAWARDLLERLPLQGDETVLDAGCGSGRVTRLLVERLPRGRVIAVDASPSMVDGVREVLRPQDRAVVADLAELSLDGQVDAVFSNAVFHWVLDHERLFRRLHDVLRPGGGLVAQCGGLGNVERFHATAHSIAEQEPFARYFQGWEGPWNFASAEATAERLTEVGFVAVDCWLEEKEVRLSEPRDYLRAVCLGPHLERLPPELRERYLDGVIERLPGGRETEKLTMRARRPILLDYVRLNVSARTPS